MHFYGVKHSHLRVVGYYYPGDIDDAYFWGKKNDDYVWCKAIKEKDEQNETDGFVHGSALLMKRPTSISVSKHVHYTVKMPVAMVNQQRA